MQASDLFVILAHAQYQKGGYLNRFERHGKWHTMSVNHGLQPIKDKTYSSPEKDMARIVERNPEAAPFVDCAGISLLETNMRIIERIRKRLNIGADIVLDYDTELRGTDRLLDICKRYGATKYISGMMGQSYLDTSKFLDSGIKVSFQVIIPEDKIPILNVI